MPIPIVANLRPSAGWAVQHLARTEIVALRTRIAIEEDYWLALRHPAEVEEVGRKLFESRYPGFAALTDAQKTSLWRELRAYVRQAEGFFRGASVLPWKSSPLNFYYAFMNLAKAVALVTGALPPQEAAEPRNLQHGLSAKVGGDAPNEWRLSVLPGVFSHFYLASIGQAITPATRLDVRKLLGYSTDVTWQLIEVGREGDRAWFPSKWWFLHNATEGWDLLAIPRIVPDHSLPPSFAASFQEVPFPAAKDFAFATLGMRGAESSNYRFFERAAPVPLATPAGELAQKLRQALEGCCYDCPHDIANGFAVGIPYSAGNATVPMNETVAAYAIIYFLSSIVRYHPDYMDSIAESRDAWLIESFAKSAPTTLLRHLTSEVLGRLLIVDRA